jgi:hypothetical protein
LPPHSSLSLWERGRVRVGRHHPPDLLHHRRRLVQYLSIGEPHLSNGVAGKIPRPRRIMCHPIRLTVALPIDFDG